MDRLEDEWLGRAYIVQIAQLCIKYITSALQHLSERPASSTLLAYQISIHRPQPGKTLQRIIQPYSVHLANVLVVIHNLVTLTT